MRWIRKGKKRRKEKKKRKGNKQGREKKSDIEREREREREKQKMGIFQAFRRLKLDGPRRKVDPRIARYAWVPKSWSFVKLRKVGNFPTWNIFSLKAM